jgi:PAS domain S-box-containing protein
MMSEKAKTTILNVDDDDAARYATSRILRKEGFEVLEASCGAEALRLAKQAPDLVLLDVNLPDMSGFEVCRMIKKDPATALIPVLHLSATYMDDLSKVKGLEAGADGYLTYPLEPPVLIAYINSLLRIGQTERKLEEAAQKWRTTFDAMVEAVSLLDKEQKFLQCNTSMKELVGKPFREIIGRYCWEVVHGTSEPIKGCPIMRMRETLRRETLIVPIGEQWFDVAVNPLLDGDGTLIGAVHILRDITARKRADAALEKSEQEKAAILDSMSELVTYQDAEHKVLWVNKAAGESVNLPPEQLVGRHCYEIWQQRSRACIGCPVEKVFETGQPQEAEITSPDGKFWYVRSCPVLDENSNSIGVVETTLEITERKQAEENLRQSEEKYRTLFEDSKDAVYITTRKGAFIDANQSALELLGYSKDELKELNAQQLYLNPLDAREFQKEIEKNGFVRDYELKLVKKDGTEMDCLFNVSVRRASDGSISAYQGIIRDITSRKRAEEQLTASLKEKELLLQEIHHRVKNNMQVISSLLKLQAETIKDERLRAPFRDSEHRVRAMSLVHEKLYQAEDFTHILFKDYLTSLIRYLYQSYAHQTGRIELVTEIEELPLDITHAIPCGLITNELLSNALTHAFPGERTGTITIGLRSPEPHTYELTVSDNGVGLPETIDLKTTTSLGLHLVSILVEDQLKGEIEVKRGKGMAFKIKFTT